MKITFARNVRSVDGIKCFLQKIYANGRIYTAANKRILYKDWWDMNRVIFFPMFSSIHFHRKWQIIKKKNENPEEYKHFYYFSILLFSYLCPEYTFPQKFESSLLNAYRSAIAIHVTKVIFYDLFKRNKAFNSDSNSNFSSVVCIIC